MNKHDINILGSHFTFDGIPLLNLNSLQLEIKKKVQIDIIKGVYQLEFVSCEICDSMEFQVLSEKDRFGFKLRFVICRKCGLIQLNPRLTEKSSALFYDQDYRKLYHGKDNEIEYERYFNNGVRNGRIIFNYLHKNNCFEKPLKDTLVLEVGCASGGILHYFRSKGCMVKGIDLGSDYIDYGRNKYNLDLHIGQINDIQTDMKPDIIIYRQVLEHIGNLNRELVQIRKHITNKGILYIEVPGLKICLYDINRKMNFLRALHIAHVYYFTKTSLNNLMKKNGFQMIKGDHRVRSLFKKAENPSDNILDDYQNSLKFLRRLELYRKMGLGHMVIKFIKVISYFKLYGIVKKLYKFLQ